MSEELDIYNWLDPEQSIRNRFKGKPREQNLDDAMLVRGHGRLRMVLDQLRYDSLRTGQGEAVMSLMRGHDTHCVLPTGMGKTAIYVVPTLCLGWRTLIFSPLISLMKDQVENLHALGLQAAQISSGQSRTDNNRSLTGWESGDVNFLLVAPERIEKDDFLRVMQRCPPSMVAVDEAHCLSQWGDSFRPSYLSIGDFISATNPRVVTTLTATATQEVEEDIKAVLGIPGAKRVIHYPKRENLILITLSQLRELDLLGQINAIEGPVIVYCALRDTCRMLTANLGRSINGKALFYHGGMTKEDRTVNQEYFMDDVVRVMFATKAFGLGVNKPNIRGIIHWNVSQSIEELVQEQGRGGRDGNRADCIMNYDPETTRLSKWMAECDCPDRQTIERVYRILDQMADKERTLQLTLEDIARRLGMKSNVVGACVGIMRASRVLDRNKDKDNPARIKVLTSNEPQDPTCKVILDQLKYIGQQRNDGYYEVVMSSLSDACCIKPSTTSAKLKLLQENNYVEFHPPFRGKTTKILGSLSLVDFERIDKRRRDKLNKVMEVEQFVRAVPDKKKHDFLLDYFGVNGND